MAIIRDELLQRISEQGEELPAPPEPLACYEPFAIANNLLFVTGQISVGKRGTLRGQINSTTPPVQVARAARAALLNVLSVVDQGLDGDWGRFERFLSVTCFFNCVASVTHHPQMADQASVFLTNLLGEHGKHVRASVGVSSLPLGAMVEISAICELRS